jgi:hypothetical protein
MPMISPPDDGTTHKIDKPFRYQMKKEKERNIDAFNK